MDTMREVKKTDKRRGEKSLATYLPREKTGINPAVDGHDEGGKEDRQQQQKSLATYLVRRQT